MGSALFIYADANGAELNCSRYRALIPAKHLNKAGHNITLQQNSGASTTVNGHIVDVEKGINYSEVTETVLIERNLRPEWIEKLRLFGAKRIIATWDDAYGIMPENADAYPWWKRNHPLFLKALAMVDAAIVPSMELVKMYKPYCKNIQYVANFLDDDDWLDLPDRGEKKIIGWGGSAEHVGSWQQTKMVRDLARVLDENPDWELHLIGGAIPQVAGLFPKGMKAIWKNWMPYPDWVKLMSSFSIGIAPLYGKYDDFRSNLKLVEYSMAGVPWVASWAPPYTNGHTSGGILTKESDWYSALGLLVKDARQRETLSASGKIWASEHLMSKNVSTYERILWQI